MRADRFGPFRLLARLGAGGMAEAWVVEQETKTGAKRRAALKRALRAFAGDAEFRRLFENEGRLALHLVHQNIVAVYDVGDADGTPWILMELVRGADLRAVLRHLATLGQPFPVDLVLLVATELAKALDYAHTLELDGAPLRIVHRDLSPSNVLVSYRGEVKLADFGIARAATADRTTRTGVLKGKIPYMAPEQVTGKRELDGRADLFALGVVLYELLSGRRPFDGAHDVETANNIMYGTHEPLRRAAPHAPEALVAIVERLIAPDPDARFRDAAALLDALTPFPVQANAARALGALVRSAQPEVADTGVAEAAPAPDRAVPLGPHGTEIVGEIAATLPGRAHATAGPGDVTRTAPLGRIDELVTKELPRTGTHELPPLHGPPTEVMESPFGFSAVPTAVASATVTPRPATTDVGHTRLTTRRSGTAWLVGGLGLVATSVLLAGGVWVAWKHGGPATRPAVAEAAAPLVAPPSTQPPEVRSVPDAGAPPIPPTLGWGAAVLSAPTWTDAGAAPTLGDAGPQGVLVVTPVPYGTVWIDGRRIGDGRVREHVSVGEHVVGVGVGRAGATRHVTVSEGRATTVALPVR